MRCQKFGAATPKSANAGVSEMAELADWQHWRNGSLVLDQMGSSWSFPTLISWCTAIFYRSPEQQRGARSKETRRIFTQGPLRL